MGTNTSKCCCANTQEHEQKMESSFKKDPLPGTQSIPVVEPVEPQAVARSAPEPAPVVKATDNSERSAPQRPKPGSEYTIQIDRTSGERLGIDVDNLDGMTLLIESVNDGLVKKWNDAHPDKEVKPGDRLVEVNGIRDKLVELVDECKKDQMLTIKFAVGKDS
mmetsp:Transcript_67523/g.106965  ORF Transcript_67523/g.106965 Transcript_67523/m.106965 type:complete len:163 (-) Transcript_67523:117-605(-)